MLNTAAAALNGSPFVNFTPFRRLKRHVVFVAFFQDTARSGRIFVQRRGSSGLRRCCPWAARPRQQSSFECRGSPGRSESRSSASRLRRSRVVQPRSSRREYQRAHRAHATAYVESAPRPRCANPLVSRHYNPPPVPATCDSDSSRFALDLNYPLSFGPAASQQGRRKSSGAIGRSAPRRRRARDDSSGRDGWYLLRPTCLSAGSLTTLAPNLSTLSKNLLKAMTQGKVA